MKKQLSIIATLGLLIMAACKKNYSTQPPPFTPQQLVTQIATIKQTINDGIVHDLTKDFLYDAGGRLKEIKYSGANSNQRGEKYAYNGNTAEYRYLIAGMEEAYGAVNYTLNNLGRIEKKLMPFFSFTDLHQYNNAGFLTRQDFIRNGSGDGYAIYHYSGNNVLDSISGFSRTGTKTIVYTFIYEPLIKNTIGNENMGLKMLGKDQASVLETKTVFVYENGNRRKSSVNQYSTILYPDGRIKRVTNLQFDYPPGAPTISFIKESMEYTYK